MGEAKRLIKAIDTISKYCRETECDNCVFANNHFDCLLSKNYPEDWHLTIPADREAKNEDRD